MCSVWKTTVKMVFKNGVNGRKRRGKPKEKWFSNMKRDLIEM